MMELLSFAEAKAGGEAMYQRWVLMCKGGGIVPPAFERGDAAWSDMFRAGYEAVRMARE